MNLPRCLWRTASEHSSLYSVRLYGSRSAAKARQNGLYTMERGQPRQCGNL